MASFWGDPTVKPTDPEVDKFAELVRKLTKKQTNSEALKTATATLYGIIYFVAERFGPREALALLDTLRSKIVEPK